MRHSLLLLLALLAGCGDDAPSPVARAAPAVTASPAADELQAQVAAEARLLAEALDLDPATERQAAAAIARAWADVEREALTLQEPGALQDALERRQVALDHELAALLDPARRARFAELGGRLEEEVQ